MTERLIALRYAGTCAQCRRPVAAGTEAWWAVGAKTITCGDCYSPADPFATADQRLRGTPGGSAQREADRQAKAGRSGRSVEAWKKGAAGERRLVNFLAETAGRDGFRLLSDRAVPNSRANLDLLAITGTGVYVIDAKDYTGKVELKASGLGRWRTEQLVVDGRDRTTLVDEMAGQVETVAHALADAAAPPPVHPVLCFVSSDWELFFSSFTVNGVRVMAPGPLRRKLAKDGPVAMPRRAELERLLAVRLPPALLPARGA